MNALSEDEFYVETTFLHELAGHYGMTITVHYDCDLKDCDLDLNDILQVCRTGYVVQTDMSESLGYWTVFGETVDSVEVELEIAVASEEMEVELHKVIADTGR